ncbi:MAG: curli-like amyloid fiber formation chaperone CsgH [Janthinobacterium lividum]
MPRAPCAAPAKRVPDRDRALPQPAARYRYELSLLRESTAGRPQNTQRGEFDVAAAQEVALSQARVNATAQDAYRIHLRVLDLAGHTVAQDSAVQAAAR